MAAEKFLEKLKVTLDLDPKMDFGLETSFADLPFWDSLALMSVIAFLDSDYAISLTAAEARSLKKVSDVYRLVDPKYV